MNEKILISGRYNHLLGIFTKPEAEVARKNVPTIILLNAGLIYRIGPYRFYVDLARQLAEHGFTTCRVDLSNIGDSQKSIDNLPEQERIINDITDIMDALESKHGITKFILGGVCWGGDISHDAAMRDTRVVGAVMLDTYGYPTLKFFLIDKILPLFKLKNWTDHIKNWQPFRRPANKVPVAPQNIDVFNRQFPLKNRVKSEIEQLVLRNVKLLYIYSGGVPIYYNYGNQFYDMFKGIDFKGNARLAYFEKADHLFTCLDVRKRMFDCIITWTKESFPS